VHAYYNSEYRTKVQLEQLSHVQVHVFVQSSNSQVMSGKVNNSFRPETLSEKFQILSENQNKD